MYKINKCNQVFCQFDTSRIRIIWRKSYMDHIFASNQHYFLRILTMQFNHEIIYSPLINLATRCLFSYLSTLINIIFSQTIVDLVRKLLERYFISILSFLPVLKIQNILFDFKNLYEIHLSIYLRSNKTKHSLLSKSSYLQKFKLRNQFIFLLPRISK